MTEETKKRFEYLYQRIKSNQVNYTEMKEFHSIVNLIDESDEDLLKWVKTLGPIERKSHTNPPKTMNLSIEITHEAFDNFSKDELKRLAVFVNNDKGGVYMDTFESIVSYLRSELELPTNIMSNSQVLKTFYTEVGLDANNSICVYFDPAVGYKTVEIRC